MRETAVELGPRSISQTSLMILDVLVEYSSLVRRTGRVGGGGPKIRIRYGRRYLHLFLRLLTVRARDFAGFPSSSLATQGTPSAGSP